MEPALPQEEPTAYRCPACGRAGPAPQPGERVLQCPGCGEQFFIDLRAEADSREPDETLAEQHAQEAELSGLRIRQLSDLRRGAYRARLWMIVGAAACIVGAARLFQISVVALRAGLRLLPIGQTLAAAAALMIAWHFIRRAGDLTREIRRSRLQDPQAPPDFSTLQDGNQRWMGLSDPHDGNATEP